VLFSTTFKNAAAKWLRPSLLHPVAFDEGCIDPPLDKCRVVEDLAMDGNGGLDALDHELGQRPPHARQGLGPRRLMDQQLRQQRIVVGRHR